MMQVSMIYISGEKTYFKDDDKKSEEHATRHEISYVHQT